MELRGYSFGFYAEDYDLWLRARRQGCYRFHNLPEGLLYYRVHKAQSSNPDNERRYLAIDIALRTRELLLTGDLKFLIGILISTRPGKWIVKLINRVKFRNA